MRVVKTLNTVSAPVMVKPDLIAGPPHDVRLRRGRRRRAQVGELLQGFGWPAEAILDLGDITAARGMETYLPLWLRLWGATGTGVLNVEVRSAPVPS